jgi:hypothetical protein
MFSFILLDGAGREIERLGRPGNERFLVRRDRSFRLLSQISPYDEDTLNSEDARELLEELELIRGELTDESERKHIDDIRRLAMRCANMASAVLVISPFAETVRQH